jgi:hypothetical protein
VKLNGDSVWVHPLEKSSNGWCSGGCWSPSLATLNLWYGVGMIHQNISIPDTWMGQSLKEDAPILKLNFKQNLPQWVLLSTLYLGYNCRWAFDERPSSVLCPPGSIYIYIYIYFPWYLKNTLEASQEKKFKKILWVFMHTKTLGHGLYMEFQDTPRPQAVCKYHIFPMTFSSLTQSFMVGFI